MDVRKVQDMRKNVEHQYITEDSKTRIYLWCENLMRRSMRNIPKKRKERK